MLPECCAPSRCAEHVFGCCPSTRRDTPSDGRGRGGVGPPFAGSFWPCEAPGFLRRTGVPHFDRAASTIARMPAFIASGRLSQASTTAAKSRRFSWILAKQAAKTRSALVVTSCPLMPCGFAALDSKSSGWGFESLVACHNPQGRKSLCSQALALSCSPQ